MHAQAQLLVWLARSAPRNLLASVVGGAFIGFIEYTVHTLASSSDVLRGARGLLDAIAIASVSAVLIYTLLRQWRLRRELVLQQLRVIAELNHEVRNALQVIVYSQYVPDRHHARRVLESANRIANALEELLPATGAAEEEESVAARRMRMNEKAAVQFHQQPRP